MNWFNNALPFAKHSPSQGVVTTREFSRHAEQAKYRVRQNHVSGAKIPSFGRTLPHYHPYLQVFWMHSNNFLRVEGLFVNFEKLEGFLAILEIFVAKMEFSEFLGQNAILGKMWGQKYQSKRHSSIASERIIIGDAKKPYCYF